MNSGARRHIALPRRLNGFWGAGFCLAAWPAAVLAIDPTLPQPGKSPAFVPAPQRNVAPAPAAVPAPAAPAPAPANPAAAEPAGAPAARVPLPDANAQKEANKLVDQVFKENIAAAKAPEQKKQLGQKFLKAAQETTNDLPGKYVLLIRARDLAADSGDLDTTLSSIFEAEKTFEVEPGSLDIEPIGRLQKTIRGAEPLRSLTRYLIGAANDAVAADKFEAARKLIDTATTTATRTSDQNLVRLANARAKEIRDVELAYLQSKPALAAVDAGGTDPIQSLTAGKYRCLFKGDFAAGLPFLATGNDPALRDLATKELAGVTGADQQLAVADGWWDEADKLQGVPKNLATIRARFWYEQSAPFLTGLPKAKADKRLKESEAIAAMYTGKAMPTAAVASAVPVTPVPPTPAPTPTPGTDTAPVPTVPLRLQPRFSREWKTPEVWKNKPELVTIKDNRVTILNEGGTNVVCKDEEFVAQKDGSMVLAWDYGENKSGYEVWVMSGKEIVIQRWNSKTEKEGGKPARRLGFIVGK